MSEPKYFAAIDLGASSGRVILGAVSPEQIIYEEIHRFGNGPVSKSDGLYWDIETLRNSVMEGLAKIGDKPIVSIGVDSWAVDYVFIDDNGELIRPPHHYRDERNHRGVEYVAEKISNEELYAQTGLQFLPFNTIYQLAVDAVEQSALLERKPTMLMIPDLFNFWLSGKKMTERTNASTTGLFSPRTLTWNKAVMNQVGLAEYLFSEVVAEGQVLGNITKAVQELTGLGEETKVVTVGSHDTASAFVAVPSTAPNSVFISSGTWSLIGVELDEPILTNQARLANFTNEGGVDGRVRFLKNVTGLWIIQESLRQWRLAGENYDLAPLLEQAANLPKRSIIDVDHESFAAPGEMPEKIQAACQKTGQWVPNTQAEIIRTIIDSLVAKYLIVIEELSRLTGKNFERIHIVGGGSQNNLLNQLIADETRLKVFAGPVEATAIGNLVIQARAAGTLNGSLEQLRELIAKSFEIREFIPN